MKARQSGNESRAPFAPAPIEDVTAAIRDAKPDVVFAPHVETSAGIILPDDYITQLAAAAHEVGALMVLDCIASGCVWVDMKATGVDVLISAPQKGWSATPSAGLVMMSDRAVARMADTASDSFAIDLKKWSQNFGFAKLKDAQWELGNAVRAVLAEKGVKSVAAEGFGAPGVVVSYTDDPAIQNGSKFAAEGMQIAAGVPLQCDEPDDFRTFRLGLFGLDKLYDVPATVARLQTVLDRVL